MDHEGVHAGPIYRQHAFVAPDPWAVITFGVQLLQLFGTLISKLTGHMKRCRSKGQCQDLQGLLEYIRPDVAATAKEVASCKRLGITTKPQESWLDRLRTELLQMENLIDRCATRGLFNKLRRGAGPAQKISAQLETLKSFADKLPQMHGVLTNLRMSAEVLAAVETRRMPSFGNPRKPEFVPDRTRYEARPYNSFRRRPWSENYRNHDAEFDVPDRSGYESRPDYWSARHRPSFEDYRNHDDELVCVDGVYFLKAQCEMILLAQPIAFRSHAWFERVPVTNPHYMKHVESEYR